MSDPVLHEPSIMQTLDCKADPENMQRLQAAACLSLVDAFDRKLQRTEFIILVEAAVALHSSISKLFLMDSIAQNYNFGHLDGPMVERAVNGLQAAAATAQDELYLLMKRVVACPTSADKVH